MRTAAPKSKKKIKLEMNDVQRETLLCQFLYTYLVYNIQQQVKHVVPDESNPVPRLYKAVLKFIQAFKESRQPPTICWLMEIMNILSMKYPTAEAYRTDQKLKKDYNETLNELLESVAVIINDSYKVSYGEGYNFLISFPPQVYELLNRFGRKFDEHIQNSQSQAQTNLQIQQAQKKAKLAQSQPAPRKPGVMLQPT